MIEVDLDQIDDPVFEIDSARIVDSFFYMEGLVEIEGRRVMHDRRPQPRVSWRERRRRSSYPITLVVKNAESFAVRDDAGTGQLILESIDEDVDRVIFRGIIPCEVTIFIAPQATVVLVIDDQRESK